MALKSGKLSKSWKVGQSSYSKNRAIVLAKMCMLPLVGQLQDAIMSVFFVYTRDGRAIVVSARDMSDKEREKYG